MMNISCVYLAIGKQRCEKKVLMHCGSTRCVLECFELSVSLLDDNRNHHILIHPHCTDPLLSFHLTPCKRKGWVGKKRGLMRCSKLMCNVCVLHG